MLFQCNLYLLQWQPQQTTFPRNPYLLPWFFRTGWCPSGKPDRWFTFWGWEWGFFIFYFWRGVFCTPLTNCSSHSFRKRNPPLPRSRQAFQVGSWNLWYFGRQIKSPGCPCLSKFPWSFASYFSLFLPVSLPPPYFLQPPKMMWLSIFPSNLLHV